MEFASFEDTTALYETTFFPRAYERFSRMLGYHRPYLLRGRVEEDYGAISLTVEDVALLEKSRTSRRGLISPRQKRLAQHG
jgi:error-prone DNA polymerase